jgi:hypothetical protein
MDPATMTWLSLGISVIILIVQGLLRYALAKQEEMTNSRFRNIEKLKERVDSTAEELRAIKVQQANDGSNSCRQDEHIRDMRSQMVTKDLFEARLSSVESRLEQLERLLRQMIQGQGQRA